MDKGKLRNGIKAPQLPKTLSPAELPGDFPTDSSTYSQIEYAQTDFTGQIITRPYFEEVVFSRVTAAESQFFDLRLHDVRFTECNLANAIWPHVECFRAEFISSRLTGFTSLESQFQDTLFKDCKIDLAQFYQAKMRGVRFESCILTGSDFREADVTGVVFSKCDLSNVDFTGARLPGADIRGCQIDGVRIGPAELHGATVDAGQALALIRIMGINIGE